MALIAALASVVPLTAGGHEAGAVAGPHGFAPFGFLLVLAVVGALGYLLLQSLGDSEDPGESKPDEALETLRRRYAQGEIDDEEFQARRDHLLG